MAMRLGETLRRIIFGADPLRTEYPRWPQRDGVEAWMRGKVAYYRTHFPDTACQLFDISCGDYLPLTVHVAGNFGSAELAAYRGLKAENPDLVEQARRNTGHFLSRSRIYDPQDRPDEATYP